MRLRALHIVLLAGLSIAAVASTAMASGERQRSAAALPAAPIWVVDKAASRLTFRAAVSGQNFDGVFKKWDAQIAFDPKNLKASHAAVTIDIASVVTGDPTRDQMLPTPDFFGVQKFPKATFVTTAITQTGPDHYQAVGDLQIKGAVRRVTLPFTLTIAKDVAKMDGALTIDRGWFGVGQGQYASSETVASNVTVMVRLAAKTSR
jgi:polyisoprenoid-binding protein YceI